MSSLKQQIHQQYLQLLQDRIDVYQDMIANLTQDALNDAKGSAGDKHETSLSRMHLEQEKIAAKLQDAIHQKKTLQSIDFTQKHTKATLGSLVKTNHVTVYISCALPKIRIDNQDYYGISSESPLGQKLLNQTPEDSFELNGVSYHILSVN